MESHDLTSAPRAGTLMLHLLGGCNLTCRHCYMEGAPTRRERLPLDRVLAAVGECEALGIGTLYLTGGEPLMYPALPDVLRTAARDAALETTVCTNATLINERNAALFGQYVRHVNVSIDGDEQFHDYFRVLDGAFRASERGIGLLVAAGVPVTIVTTMSQSNLHLLRAIADWSLRVGAVKLRVQPLLKLGRAVDIAGQCLTSVQLNDLILQLTDLANRYRGRLDCSLVGVTRRFLLAHPCGAYVCNGAGCHRRVAKEIKKVVVREDGTVLPEVTNLSHAFAIGSIEDGPLSTMVARYFQDGYHRFDQLCRTTYAEVLPDWTDPVVPWDQLVAERSHSWRAGAEPDPLVSSCGACAS